MRETIIPLNENVEASLGRFEMCSKSLQTEYNRFTGKIVGAIIQLLHYKFFDDFDTNDEIIRYESVLIEKEEEKKQINNKGTIFYWIFW